jgi:protein TonB
MIDIIRDNHIPLYDRDRPQGLSKSLYWGIGLAVLLHVLLVWYLIHQSFSGPAPEPAPPPQPSIGLTLEPAPPPPLQKEHTVPPRIAPHETPLDPPPTVVTTPIAPVKNLTQTASSTPPVIDSTPQPNVSASASSAAPAYVTPRWTRFPDGNALASYYPPRALENETEGSSMVECTVLDETGRVACVAVMETPRGYGFGAATARMVQERGRVDTHQGDVRIGSKLRTTVKWTLN